MTQYAGMGKFEIEEWMNANTGCGHSGWHTLRFFNSRDDAIADCKRMAKAGRTVRYLYDGRPNTVDEAAE